MAGLNPNPTVEVLYAAKAVIGEGPFYEQESNQLLWVDIVNHTINFLNLETKENRSVKLPGTVSAVLPVEGSDKLLAALVGRKICLVDRENGSIVEELGEVDKDKPANRFNDGKCDAEGRLWCGTMGPMKGLEVEPEMGSFFSFSSGKITKVASNIGASNGIEWSLDRKTLYYVDSLPKKVYAFDYSQQDGAISNQRLLIDFSQDESLGLPDGMCGDSEGRLWIACAFGKRVTCWDPKKGEKVYEVEIPGALKVTSCCFGGLNNEWLFVTSCCIGADEEEWRQFPNGGDLFVIKDMGARGFPAHKFKH